MSPRSSRIFHSRSIDGPFQCYFRQLAWSTIRTPLAFLCVCRFEVGQLSEYARTLPWESYLYSFWSSDMLICFRRTFSKLDALTPSARLWLLQFEGLCPFSPYRAKAGLRDSPARKWTRHSRSRSTCTHRPTGQSDDRTPIWHIDLAFPCFTVNLWPFSSNSLSVETSEQ